MGQQWTPRLDNDKTFPLARWHKLNTTAACWKSLLPRWNSCLLLPTFYFKFEIVNWDLSIGHWVISHEILRAWSAAGSGNDLPLAAIGVAFVRSKLTLIPVTSSPRCHDHHNIGLCLLLELVSTQIEQKVCRLALLCLPSRSVKHEEGLSDFSMKPSSLLLLLPLESKAWSCPSRFTPSQAFDAPLRLQALAPIDSVWSTYRCTGSTSWIILYVLLHCRNPPTHTYMLCGKIGHGRLHLLHSQMHQQLHRKRGEILHVRAY